MADHFKAVFGKQNDGNIIVHCVNERSGSRTYIGDLDRIEGELKDHYEGDFVFCIAATHIVFELDADFLPIPLNVLREIADYSEASDKDNLAKRGQFPKRCK